MKGLRKKAQRWLYPQKNERQQNKTSSKWYKKQEKKGRTRSSEYPNTKIWNKTLYQKMSAVSRILIV